MSDDLLSALAPVGGTLSGRVGTVVYSRNRHGPYSYEWSPRVDPNTVMQQDVRSGFDNASSLWRHRAQTERDGWNRYARNTPRPNRVGTTRCLSGFQCYMGAATLRQRFGDHGVVWAPKVDTRGKCTLPRLQTIGSFFVAFFWYLDDPWRFHTRSRMLVGRSILQPPTVHHFTGPFYEIITLPGHPLEPPISVIELIYPLPNPSYPTVFFSFRVLEEDNRISSLYYQRVEFFT